MSATCALSALHVDLVCAASDESQVPALEMASAIGELLPDLLELLKDHKALVHSISNRSLVVVVAEQEDHAFRAVRASAACHRLARSLSERRVAAGKRPIKLRIGVCSGDGLVQTYDFPQYTGQSFLGAPLSISEALKQAAHPGETLLSGDTYHLVHEHIPCRLVKRLRLRGYDDEIKAYEVLSAEEAEALASLQDNRRKYPRLVLNLPVTLQVAQWSHRAEALNISAGGVLVACKDSFKAQTPVKISAVLPVGRRELPLRIEGVVMHSTEKGDGRYAMGIRFKRLVSEDREALEHLLGIILGEVLKGEELRIDVGEDAAGIPFFAYEASALLDDIDL